MVRKLFKEKKKNIFFCYHRDQKRYFKKESSKQTIRWKQCQGEECRCNQYCRWCVMYVGRKIYESNGDF